MSLYEEKRSFVCTKLAPMLMAIDNDAVNIRYVVKDDNRELVYVTFRRGGTRCIDVTADSFYAIAIDVLKCFC